MAMLEHDATLPTRYVIERLMYRVVDTVLKCWSRTPRHSPIRARAQKLLIGRQRSKELRVTRVSHRLTGKSVRRVYRLIDLILSSANDYIKCVFAVAVVLTWSIFSTRPLIVRLHITHQT